MIKDGGQWLHSCWSFILGDTCWAILIGCESSVNSRDDVKTHRFLGVYIVFDYPALRIIMLFGKNDVKSCPHSALYIVFGRLEQRRMKTMLKMM